MNKTNYRKNTKKPHFIYFCLPCFRMKISVKLAFFTDISKNGKKLMKMRPIHTFLPIFDKNY